MTMFKKISFLFLLGILISCGGKEEKKQDGFQVQRQKTTEKPKETTNSNITKASERIDLESKGVGPISNINLNDVINKDMVAEGKAVYDQMCLACHRVGKKFIGPAPNGILERRTPEWVMNMILNPEGMVKEDPLAKDLFMEFNGSPMANQGLSEEQARAVLEYFRTL